MKSVVVSLCLVLSFIKTFAQSENAAGKVIEGGKVVVELIKVLKGKSEKNPGCKDLFADLCVINESAATIHVSLHHRSTNERREMIIQPKMHECCLQARAGVWTYDLRINESTIPMRKGDLLLEGCQNLTMNVKF